MPSYTDISVLVADDSTVQRDHAVGLLHKLGVGQVLEAADGEMALAILSTRPVDILMTDLEMPGMDGIELIRRVAQQQLVRALVVFSTHGRGMLNVVEAMAQEQGLTVLGVLPKPVRQSGMAGLLSHFSPDQPDAAKQATGAAIALEEIRTAIDAEQLVLHYQPKVTALSGVLYGVEALVRWQHPQLGLLSPAHFVAIAEEGGLIDHLTDWVLKTALNQLHDWHGKGLRITVGINLSPKSLAMVDLADRIASMTAKAGVDPKFVVLEITETAVATDLALALGSLARLRLKGFGLSIDDFGTGFSSLQQLSRIPFTELKIDRSMVDGAAGHPPLHTLLKSTIDMGKKLHLTTVAEGVEVEADWQLLRLLGCDVIQGYYAAKPMPADQLPNWLKHGLQNIRTQAKKTEPQ